MGPIGGSRLFARRSCWRRRRTRPPRRYRPRHRPGDPHGVSCPHFAELLGTRPKRPVSRRNDHRRPGGLQRALVRGKPVDVLRHERDELQATLVALGGRRSSRFLGIMLGDTGTQLVHDAACSVLLAFPADDRPWQPRKIVVGFDGSTYAAPRFGRPKSWPGALSGSVEVVAATGGKPVERDAPWSDRWTHRIRRIRSPPSLSARARRPRCRRLTRRPRPPRTRQCQRTRRSRGSLHGLVVHEPLSEERRLRRPTRFGNARDRTFSAFRRRLRHHPSADSAGCGCDSPEAVNDWRAMAT